MKILIAYDGSECAEAALDDLTRAGLPRRAETLVFAVLELWLPPPHPEAYVLMPDTGQQPDEEANRIALGAVERLKQTFLNGRLAQKLSEARLRQRFLISQKSGIQTLSSWDHTVARQWDGWCSGVFRKRS